MEQRVNETNCRIELDGGQSVTAVRVSPDVEHTGWTFIYAPGAGSNINDAFGRSLSAALAAIGIETVRFQFPYVEARRRFPDRPPVLEATWESAITQVRARGLRLPGQDPGPGPSQGRGRLVVGGRSMGGRIASQVVAKGIQVDALILFAYPLHPPGQPENLRTAHLPRVDVRTLFCSGTADEFGTVEELKGAVSLVPNARLQLLEHADHGFGPVKGSGKSRREIFEEAIGAAVEFIRAIR
jgi:predicted alpha/beta-hydrolase family hydrolase